MALVWSDSQRRQGPKIGSQALALKFYQTALKDQHLGDQEQPL